MRDKIWIFGRYAKKLASFCNILGKQKNGPASISSKCAQNKNVNSVN